MGNATKHVSPARRSIPGKSSDLSIIIPCAGMSKRMKGVGAKCLLEIGGQSLIQRQLNILWDTYPKADIFVSIGFQAERIRKHLKDYPVRFIYNPIFEATNVVFSIGLALQACNTHNILVIYGDLIYNKESVAEITSGYSKILAVNSFKEEEVGFIEHKGVVTNLAFGLPNKWGHMVFLRDRELELFRQTCYNPDSAKWFGYEALNDVINQDGHIEVYRAAGANVLEIDNPQDLNI